MSSTDKVVGLTRFLKVLPKTEISAFTIIFLSFILGGIAFLIDPTPTNTLVMDFISGGTSGVLVFGLASIISGFLTQTWVNSFKKFKMKLKQSMFLSLICVFSAQIIYVIGCGISSLFNINLILNFIIFACALIFLIRTLVIRSTTNIKLLNSSLIAGIQPVLILSLLIIVSFFTTSLDNIGFFTIFGIAIKVLISSFILFLAVYSFISIIESPMKNNLGLGALELLSLFLAHLTQGSTDIERSFEEIGEPIDTLVSFVSFKKKNGDIKSLFISPCVHPGPLGVVGGSNMPTVLAEAFDHFAVVSHGPSTHDFNPVSEKELDKIEKVIKDSLNDINYHDTASEFFRVQSNKADIGVQFIGDDLILLLTLAPHGFDDIEFGVGLALLNEAKNKCKSENIVIVDCHNSFLGEKGRVLAGNKEVFDFMDAIDKIGYKEKYQIQVGCNQNRMDDFTKEEGIGLSGVKTLVIEVNKQKTAYVVFDGNNMLIGYRAKLIDAIMHLGIVDAVEVMTTDTHIVNTLSGGHNPVGTYRGDEIIQYAIDSIKEAVNDLEPVSAGCKTCKVEDLKTFGPTNSTELISTISSIAAVSKLVAPLILILAIVVVFIWIFLGLIIPL